jgi:hypothetical protein
MVELWWKAIQLWMRLVEQPVYNFRTWLVKKHFQAVKRSDPYYSAFED